MTSERQRIESAPIPSVESMPPPPPYEELNNNVFTAPMYNGSTDGSDYFLGEVSHLL